MIGLKKQHMEEITQCVYYWCLQGAQTFALMEASGEQHVKDAGAKTMICAFDKTLISSHTEAEVC